MAIKTLVKETQFSKLQISLLRTLWVILFAFLLLFFIGGLPYQFQALAEPCDQAICFYLEITTEEAHILRDMGLSLNFFAGFHIFIELLVGGVMAILGVVIFAIHFKERIGTVLAFMLILTGLNFLVEADSAFIRNYPVFQAPFDFISSITIIPLLLLFYTFPNGRFAPRWTAYLIIPFTIILTVLAFFNDFINESNPTTVEIGLTIFFVICMVLGFGSQIYRYRRISTNLQKQQTKWVMLGFAAFLFVLLNFYIWYVLFVPEPGFTRLFLLSGYYGFMALLLAFFPATFVIAMMRYRLWEIDIIIRRTVQYTAVSAVLITIYYGSVVTLQTVFTNAIGEQSPLVIVISTLLTAALFNPLRTRLQTFIDRRFFRQKYDAQQILAKFAQTTRDEVDMAALQTELLKVVQGTMQPESVSIWIKK